VRGDAKYKYGLGFAKAILREVGFAKPRLMFLKFGGILGLPPRRRVREECGAGEI